MRLLRMSLCVLVAAVFWQAAFGQTQQPPPQLFYDKVQGIWKHENSDSYLTIYRFQLDDELGNSKQGIKAMVSARAMGPALATPFHFFRITPNTPNLYTNDLTPATITYVSNDRLELRQDGATNPEVYNRSGFYMFLASDTQWPWALPNDTTKTDAWKRAEATRLNENHTKSMKALEGELGANNVAGVIINGDLTAYGHANELAQYKRIWEDGLGIKIYPGLGNHDYANNVNDQWYTENNYANRMVRYIEEKIREIKYIDLDFWKADDYSDLALRTTYEGSFAYSWDIGNFHFVQLQYHPIYTREWYGYDAGLARILHFKIRSSLNWLKHDLAKARNEGKVIILNYHDSDHHFLDYELEGGTVGQDYIWQNYPDRNAAGGTSRRKRLPVAKSQAVVAEYKQILQDYDVSAVFTGHLHNTLGKSSGVVHSQSFVSSWAALYGNVPVFRCGSADKSKYLLVHFEADSMKVQNMSSINGLASRTGAALAFPLNSEKPNPPLPVPAKDGRITFFNQGGYVGTYHLIYAVDGRVVQEKVDLALGNMKSFLVPSNAISVNVIGLVNTGAMIFTNFLATPPRDLTYKTWGTTLHPNYSTDAPKPVNGEFEVDGNNRIQTSQTDMPSETEIGFSHSLAENLDWWKGIKLFDRNNNELKLLEVNENGRGPVNYTLPTPKTTFGDKIKIEIWKAKTAFRTPTHVETVYFSRTECLGKNTNLRWLTD